MSMAAAPRARTVRRLAVAAVPVILLALAPPARAVPLPPLCEGRVATIPSTTGPDILIGTPGNDVINALAGGDQIFGLGGADIICPGPGVDQVDGGEQDDTIVADATGDGIDTFRGGPGVDLVTYKNRTLPLVLDIDTAADDGQGQGSEGDTIWIDVEMVTGGSGDDIIQGSDQGEETLRGGPGDDTISGGGATYGNGADYLYGDEGDDLMYGFTGDDLLVGGGGRDDLHGGPGNDRFGESPGSAGPDGADTISGGPGDRDEVTYAERTARVEVSLDGVANDGGIFGVRGAGLVSESDNVQPDVEVLVGGSGDDLLVAPGTATPGLYPVDFNGMAGADSLIGGATDDRLFGADGDDEIGGIGGDDEVRGGEGDDRLFGDEGDDTIRGDNGQDLHVGWSGDDTILATDGYYHNDSVFGGRWEFDGPGTPPLGQDVCYFDWNQYQPLSNEYVFSCETRVEE
jgi:Ca2+-binding RTX toxin-like protein